jgi:hypothetical protein
VSSDVVRTDTRNYCLLGKLVDAPVVCPVAFFPEKFRLFSQAAWREPHADWEQRFDNPLYIVSASSTMDVFTGSAFEREFYAACLSLQCTFHSLLSNCEM